MKYVVNGKFLCRKITGVERYAYEILLEFDKLVESGEMAVAVPSNISTQIKLHNIEIVTVGKLHGNLWEQIDLPLFIKKNNAIGIHLCNVAPITKPDIVCVHDMNIRANPWNYKRIFVLWYRFVFYMIEKYAKQIITVSYFSKGEMEKYYPKSLGRIKVVGNGWQHMARVKEDERIFDRIQLCKDAKYYFAMSSMTSNKNIQWILRAAKKYQEMVFVIAGKFDLKVFGDIKIEKMDNVIYPGYISDGEAKALMHYCVAFLFPSFYEGFGIPPMEAISVGTDIICSDIPVLHEIYGEAATYIDPNGDGTIELKHISAEKKKAVLEKYSFQKSACELYYGVLQKV